MSTVSQQRLLKGYKAFRAGNYKKQKALYEGLGSQGQSPKVMLIGCADSRVDPTDIFNASPGEMFVARNVANIVPPADDSGASDEVASAIQFAVTALKVDTIVVMGHESCGGIRGCLDGMGDDPKDGFVGRWVSNLNGARDRVLAKNLPEEETVFELELEGVRQSLENLKTYSFVKEAMDAGNLTLKGAYFSIFKAHLMLANKQGEFYTVDPDSPASFVNPNK